MPSTVAVRQALPRIRRLTDEYSSQRTLLAGVTMTAFRWASTAATSAPRRASCWTAAHLVSWAKLAAIDKQSTGRAKAASTGKGNPWLAGALGEIVAGLARTDTFLSDRYRRLARRRGKKRAIVAVGNSVQTIIWHVLSDPDTRYHELRPSYHNARDVGTGPDGLAERAAA